MSSIYRKPHILKSEKTMAMPRHIIFFDTETYQETIDNYSTRQRLRLGWACYYRRAYGRHPAKVDWFYFDTHIAFWQFVFEHTAPKVKLWVIARNLTFDFTVVKGWRHLRKAGYKLKFFHNQGTCNIISVRNKSKALVFLDSMNWFVESLEKTGDRIGIKRIAVDYKTCSKSELSAACKNHALIELENFKLFIRFLEGNKVARLCYTRGSTAMAAFLLSHYTTKIYIHNNKQAIDLERESYKGGRVECFYLGVLNNENYYILDVNSLYPFVMRNNPYPVKYKQIKRNITPKSLLASLYSKAVVAKVLIETDLPVYAVRRGRCMFPVGRFWATLCTPELKYAFAHNHIKQVDTCVLYKQENIFRSYVDKFYTLRMDFKSAGVDEYVELCKKMLNSLYGKFGQKGENWSKIGDCPNEPDREELVFNVGGRRATKLRYLLGELFIMRGHGESFDSFPAIAAHVAAYGRMYLWAVMQQAGYGNYFYCDTDSLFVNDKGLHNLENLLDNTALGAIKIIEHTNLINIRGLKDYTIGNREVIKGIRKLAIKVADGVYEQEIWPSFKGLLRRQHPDVYAISTIRKRLSREYTKGTVSPDGVVVPFVFADDY
ncbi:unnamed protein product [marine sediment metagenome]|uniref:DNA-directed DNA polymerase n=1 Tax=marine sediment metagenome TaxID=412755 RepID=X1QKS2_9ZZZZ